MSENHIIYGSPGLINAFENVLEEMFRTQSGVDGVDVFKRARKNKNKSTKIMEGNKLDIQVTDRNRSYGDSRVYRYLINGESALRFDQIPYPECCGIAIIKNFSANSDISKVDFIDAINKFIIDMQENDAFSKVLFYTNAGSNGDRLFSQIPNVIILDSFKNNRSGNILIGFEIDLLEKKYKKTEPVTSDELRGDGTALYFNEEASLETTLGRGLLDQVRSIRVPSYFFDERF